MRGFKRVRRRAKRVLLALGLLGAVALAVAAVACAAVQPVSRPPEYPAAQRPGGPAKQPARLGSVTTTSLPAYPAVPVDTPLFSQGMRLPVSLPTSSPVLKVPILEFHAVGDRPVLGPMGERLTITTAEFEAQMNYLASAGYTPVTLEDVFAALARLRPLPRRPVALTFDDGYVDNFTVAFPILQAHHFKATFFVITGAVGKMGCVTWPDLRTMHAAGMAIESHTVHHPNLTLLPPSGLAYELTQSRAAIAAETGQVPAALSYPMGDQDPSVEAAAKAAGYLMAVTAASTSHASLVGARNVFKWPRIAIQYPEPLSTFVSALR